MCTNSAIQHQFTNSGESFYQSQHCISNGWTSRVFESVTCVDINHRPHVTFLGPRDAWRKVAHKYKHLFEMETKIAYDWLTFWVNANHPSFKECTID